MALGFSTDLAYRALLAQHSRLKNNAAIADTARKFINAIASVDGLLWKASPLPYRTALNLPNMTPQSLSSDILPYDLQHLWTTLTNKTGGSAHDHWIPDITRAIEEALTFPMPPVRIIPATRQIGPKGADFADFSGNGLIDQLAAIQNPEHDRRSERAKFDKINGFLQSVTGRQNAVIEIPYSRDHVLVHMDGRVLPLSSLGTGIHEVIMIAAFCTIAEEEIVCIEEPEIHLHPLLQRKLIKYLGENTSNQYFIATHSASFIDTPGAAIFHVYQENSATHITEAVLKRERYAICVDLGHRASDIVQANAVIWVEGPSDRIYLQHWLSIAAPELVEGLHYSIMFYGGRLLSHLAADDEDVSHFIQLRNLN